MRSFVLQQIHYLKNKSKFGKDYTSSSLEHSLELSEPSSPDFESFEFYDTLLLVMVFIVILNRLSMR